MKSLGRLVYLVLALPWYTDKTVNLYSSRKQRLVLLHVQTFFLCQILFSTFMSEEQQKKKGAKIDSPKKKKYFFFHSIQPGDCRHSSITSGKLH